MTFDFQKFYLVLLISAVVFIGPAVRAQDMPKEIIVSARADFMTYCAVCHGRKGVGDGPVAKDLTSQPADLTTLAKKNGGALPEDLIHMVIDGRQEVMGHGTRDMPIWGSWFKFVARSGELEGTDEETSEIIVALRIQSMIEYLKTIQVK